MNKKTERSLNVILVGLLMSAVSLSAQHVPQNTQNPAQTQPLQAPDDAQKPLQTSASPSTNELPDAPTHAQAAPQEQSDHDPLQAQSPGSVPSGAAGAKVPHPNGAPAARPIASAIAPAKQRGRRSLLIKVGIVTGACVAVGSVYALSRGTSAKPPGAP